MDIDKRTAWKDELTIRATGKISPLQRMSVIVLVQHARETKDLNSVTFEMSVAEFERLIGHSLTGNREYLREVVSTLTAVPVELSLRGEQQDASHWNVVNLPAEMFIENDGRIRYSLPPYAAKKLLDPDVYIRFDL
jgi:hypothetical protein